MMSAETPTKPRAATPDSIPEPIRGYLIAVLCIIIASLTHTFLSPYLGDMLPFIFYFPAVVIAAWYGGLGPAVLTVVLGSLVAILFFMAPVMSLEMPRPQDRWELLIYIFVGLATAFISEAQRRSNQRAIASEQLLKTTLRSIGDAVIATDTTSRVTFVNSVAEELTGWSESDAIGIPCDEVFRVVDETTRESVESPAQRALSENTVIGQSSPSVLIARDGSERPIDDRGTPIKNERGDLLGAVLVFRDISERLETERERAQLYAEAQAALAASAEAVRQHKHAEEKLTLLTEATGALIGSLDQESVLPDIISLAERLIGADAYAVWRLDHDQGRWIPAASQGLSDQYQRAAVEALDHTMPMPDRALVIEDLGDEPIVSGHQGLLRTEGFRSLLVLPLNIGGETSGTLVFYHREPHRFNSTELKIGGALANIAASTITTAGLYQQVWRRADDLAEEDRHKNEFLAMLAHELRNPIGAINNAAAVLENAAPLAEEFRRSLEVVARQTRHMSHLVNDLLDVSRISRGKIQIQLSRIDLAALIQTTVDDHRRIFEAAGLTVSVDFQSRPLWVDGDPTRLRQIIGNLLQNAAKFTNRGGAISVRARMEAPATSDEHADEINIASRDKGSRSDTDDKSAPDGKPEPDETSDPPAAMVKVEVQDTGIGISAEMLPRLFDAFVQADRSLDRTQGGLGLGLALVKGIAEQHGGHVGVQSEGPDKGSLFYFTIPAQSAPASVTPVSALTADTDRSLSILIIEDNPDAAETLRDLLDLLGHRVTVATSGTKGVEEARQIRPDAVLCDIGLPGMDGYAVAAALRKDPNTAGTCLIAISGYSPELAAPQFHPDRFDLRLTKPIDPLRLKEILAAVKEP